MKLRQSHGLYLYCICICIFITLYLYRKPCKVYIWSFVVSAFLFPQMWSSSLWCGFVVCLFDYPFKRFRKVTDMKQDKKWLMAGWPVLFWRGTEHREPDPTSYEHRQRTQCLGVPGPGLWSDLVTSSSSSPMHCIVSIFVEDNITHKWRKLDREYLCIHDDQRKIMRK